MPTKNVQFTVVCEDREHESFVRGALEQFGFRSHNIDARLPPAGCGEQWVRIETAKWVPRIRARSKKVTVALISVIDADAMTVEERRKQIEDEIARSGCSAREEGESIAFLIPKRNIEAWVRFLLDGDADEDQDFKRRVTSGEPRRAGGKFPTACGSKSRLLSSMRAGCAEFKRATPSE